MFSPAMIIVQSRISDLQAEAAANRLAAQARTDRGESRVANALTRVRSILGSSVDAPMALPKLSDYPYRG
jgi:hypothetical protein